MQNSLTKKVSILKKIQLFSAMLFAVLLTACKQSPAPDYAGTWQNTAVGWCFKKYAGVKQIRY
ncbi:MULTISPECIES: hypothetical protein [unclassified Acinetobacter]|uniref:hypothetical protein n=1 Tax=unclassified Acinetobacter TaxID=196816 RepID=UPI0015D1BBE4|nr:MULTISPECIES: hypothetical protein [unclassified Acinetobacter]